MRFFFFTIAFVTSLALVIAQDLQGLPSCALTCFAIAVPAAGCSLSDTKCQCTTGRDSITNSVAGCVPGKCSADDIASIIPAVTAICQRAGVTVSNIPTAVSPGSATKATGSATAVTSGSVSNATGSAKGSATTATSGLPGSRTSSGVAQQSTNAAAVNFVGAGAVALGVAAAFGL